MKFHHEKERLHHVWVIGGGRFGRKAVELFCRQKKDINITVVEKDREKCAWFTKFPVRLVQKNAIDFMEENMHQHECLNWIVPMVPFHLAYEWIKRMCSEKNKIVPAAVPDQMLDLFPNPIKGEKGTLYTSIADFLCPENCPAPEKICSFTQKKRMYFLYKKIKSTGHHGFTTVVIQSRQIFPGVGGYAPEDLFQALAQVRMSKIPVLLSTACRCHGVVDLFQVGPNNCLHKKI